MVKRHKTNSLLFVAGSCGLILLAGAFMVTPSAYAIGNSVGDDQGQLVAAPSKDRAKKSSASASQSKYGALPPKAWYLVDEGILSFDKGKQAEEAKAASPAPSAPAKKPNYGALPPKQWYLVDEGIVNFDRGTQVEEAKAPTPAPSAPVKKPNYGALPPKAWYLVDEGILNFDRAKQVQDAKKPSTAPQKETSDNAVANISH